MTVPLYSIPDSAAAAPARSAAAVSDCRLAMDLSGNGIEES